MKDYLWRPWPPWTPTLKRLMHKTVVASGSNPFSLRHRPYSEHRRLQAEKTRRSHANRFALAPRHRERAGAGVGAAEPATGPPRPLTFRADLQSALRRGLKTPLPVLRDGGSRRRR